MNQKSTMARAWEIAREAAKKFGGKASEYMYSGTDPKTGEHVKGALEIATEEKREEKEEEKDADAWLNYIIDWIEEFIENVKLLKAYGDIEEAAKLSGTGKIQVMMETYLIKLKSLDNDRRQKVARTALGNKHMIERDFTALEPYSTVEGYDEEQYEHYIRMALDLQVLMHPESGIWEIVTGKEM